MEGILTKHSGLRGNIPPSCKRPMEAKHGVLCRVDTVRTQKYGKTLAYA